MKGGRRPVDRTVGQTPTLIRRGHGSLRDRGAVRRASAAATAIAGGPQKALEERYLDSTCPGGFAKHFVVMYTEPGQPVPDTEVEILASFTLPDRRTVVITVFEHAISEEQQEQIEAYQGAMAEGMSQATPGAQAAFEAALEPRGYLYGHNEHGTRFFIDIAGSPILDTD